MVRFESDTKITSFPNTIWSGRVFVRCPHCNHKMFISGDSLERKCSNCNELFFLDGAQLEKFSWEQESEDDL